MGRRRVITNSARETVDLGLRIGESLEKNNVLCFFGDLAAGKTTLIKGIVQQITGIKAETVNSPTFAYLNIYDGPRNVYHFDLYRLNNSSDFLAHGFEEYFSADGVCCIEWSERIEEILPPDHMAIHINHLGENMREIWVS
ncbi:MAG: tRNA threonylcarbamoyladenosine biosynthesis protein TsaE [Chlamydiae bacterium]|nr:tRNA threonylcarbamoyladenosine biosynthesis protein TsaE [Chlamydiota bacterium]